MLALDFDCLIFYSFLSFFFFFIIIIIFFLLSTFRSSSCLSLSRGEILYFFTQVISMLMSLLVR